MRIYSKCVLDIATDQIVYRETFEYTGPVAQAFSASSGLGGSGSKSQSKQQSQQTSQSGTQFNEDFLNKALNYFGGPKVTPEEKALLQQKQAEAKRAYDAYATNARTDQNDPEKFRLGAELQKADADFNAANAKDLTPEYNPQYVKGQFTPGAFTGAQYTPVDGGDFNRIEQNLYGGQQARLGQAYEQNVARQREELSQSGALNSPAQFLEGSARSSLDRSFMENLQQAARDASTTALGLKQQEAARKTGFDVGQAGARTAYDVGEGAAQTAFSTGEAGRETQFNAATQQAILDNFWKKLMLALESGRFSFGQGTSSGSSSSVSGSGSTSGSFGIGTGSGGSSFG